MKYLEELLNGATVEWKTLGEVSEIGTGSSNRQDEVEGGEYPFYVRSKKVLRSSSYQFDETAIIIPGEGGIGDIFHYVEGKYALHQRAYRVHLKDDQISTKFLYYFMTFAFRKYILSKIVGATAISIRKPMLEQFLIPIPPIEVQRKIVEILDNFAELTAELTA
ncbi:restriction endonuclease subunit S [Porphyromonas sp.]|uniref:restriction endonuclease subunit S n=1 Tax=Porphyromonas sp. TaxID=1924944 RepID=UPI0026DCF145|nr:restriction endonuclease subunit S [Porphyromonas sp.]MDO4771594.1 restriction endonuclease subunit S [Porphyromonas sp.]